MKRSLFFHAPLLFLLLSIAVFTGSQCKSLKCEPDYWKRTKKEYKCPGYKVVRVLTVKNPDSLKFHQVYADTITALDTVRYICNQIIFTPGAAGPNADKMRQYLACQGFKLERTCKCTDSFELWAYEGADDADVIEIVEDPPKDNIGHGIGGLSLNYEMPFTDSLERVSVESEDRIYRSPQENQRISIAITDTGVDLDPNGQLRQNNYLWNRPMTPCKNRQILGRFGLNMLAKQFILFPFKKEPEDIDGHGTFVNGILAGIANNIPAETELLNIKVSDGKPFSVFDAVCGLFFGFKQGVRLFNVSWGYLDTTTTTAVPNIFSTLLQEMPEDAILVTGMGNNNRSLDHNARFWPACLAEIDDRVISVGAAKSSGNLASFSNFSSNPQRMTLLARGVGVVSLAPRSLQNPPKTGYARGSGTSFATPFVTRRVANIMATSPALSPGAIKASIVKEPNTTLINSVPVLNNQ